MARTSVAILAVAVAHTASAAGQDTGSVGARLEVRADTACAAQSDIVAGVARRSSRIRFVSDGSDVTRFRASVRPSDGGEYSAELAVVQASGRRSSRRFMVKSCAEAVDALALVIVMTLDPESSTLAEGGTEAGGADPASVGPAAQGTAGSAGASGRSSSAASAGTTAGTTAGSPANRAGDDEAELGVSSRDETSRATTSSLTLGLAAQGVTGPAPSLMPGVAVQALWTLERGSLWSPAARLGAGYHWLGAVQVSGGTADFGLPLFALELCPVSFGPVGIALRPCLLGAVGPLSAAGSNTFDPRRETRPFAAVGASLIASVDIGRKLQLCGNAGLGASLITDTFAFSPHVFHEVPGAVVLLGLGVGYRFSVIE